MKTGHPEHFSVQETRLVDGAEKIPLKHEDLLKIGRFSVPSLRFPLRTLRLVF